MGHIYIIVYFMYVLKAFMILAYQLCQVTIYMFIFSLSLHVHVFS